MAVVFVGGRSVAGLADDVRRGFPGDHPLAGERRARRGYRTGNRYLHNAIEQRKQLRQVVGVL